MEQTEAQKVWAALRSDKEYKGTAWDNKVEVTWLSTGASSLDIALGNGLALGRIIEIIGPESSGKTTLCFHALSSAQKVGKDTFFLDVEGTFDPNYFSAIGTLDHLMVAKPDVGEEALNIAHQLVKCPNAVVAVDSVAALVPEAEDEKDIGESSMGLQARLMSQAMRKISKDIHPTSLLIFTNQIREKIGVMYGSPETTPGGRALKFYASQRLDIRRIGALEGDRSGNRVRVKLIKSKVSNPFTEVELDLVYGKGIDLDADRVEYLLATKQMIRKGAWYEYDGLRAQGKDAMIQLLKEPRPA